MASLSLQTSQSFKITYKPLEGKLCKVTIEEYKDGRSLNQNAYYWGVVIKLLCEHTGYFDDEMHEALKYKFLPNRPVEIGRETIKVTSSSTKLNTKEFMDYVEKIKAYAASELGVIIPDPE
jgi:hypothetical protein